MSNAPMRALALASLFVLNLTFFPQTGNADDSSDSPLVESSDNRSTWAGPSTLGAFVHRVVNGRIVCLEASLEQARSIKDRDSNQPLSVLAPDSATPIVERRGLRIILRGTSQLESFPGAIEAFKRARARWESLIQTDATVVIDVDFGAAFFGNPFDDDVAAITDAQVLGGNSLYTAVRAALISEAYTPEKISLYNSLPTKAVPTDMGISSGMTASSATLRALGLIDPIADPDGELNSFGQPPAIGLNSKVAFDFDPNDGIDQDKLDFEAIALHEMGHALGFISFVDQQDVNSSIEIEPSTWDLFRIRPRAVKSDFAAAERILSSGGEQSFCAGGTNLPLSTGSADGKGGDGRQASHWKDDNLAGQYLGVMDPTIGPGEHQFITDNDISVLEAMGYRTKSVMDPTTFIILVSGQPQRGGIVAPPPNLGSLSHTHYSIAVPPGATQLTIELSGNQDVDLFARFGQAVVLRGHNPKTDYMSTTDSSSETITVTPASSLPLRPGIYYIAVANFGPGEADFTVTATVTGGANRFSPVVFNIKANLEGDLLGLDFAAIDRDGDFAMADISILDEAGRAIGSSRFAIDSRNSTRLEAQLAISGLGAIRTARRATLTLIDGSGNRSPEATVDFSKAQAGGLTVIGAAFVGSKLTLDVSGHTSNLELEINGRVLSPQRIIKVKASGKKLMVKGNREQLALQVGANRIRVKNGYGWSNIFILNI